MGRKRTSTNPLAERNRRNTLAWYNRSVGKLPALVRLIPETKTEKQIEEELRKRYL